MYQPKLSVLKTEEAIKFIKDEFERLLANTLHLKRVSAPLFVDRDSGLNDHLNGTEKPLHFNYDQTRIEIVQSLAKWKRNALYEYGFEKGVGLFTDMNAIRPSETLDETHSLYVDQWDWEKVINNEDRTLKSLKTHVHKIYDAFLSLEEALINHYDVFEAKLPKEIFFIDSQHLLDKYPTHTPEARENLIAKEKGAVFILKIGNPLSNGVPHDLRSPDYDDWQLNGDLLVWHTPLQKALELSSMGIRVNEKSLKRQIKSVEKWPKGHYHETLLNGTLPQTIGGGIGQSRVCQYFLEKYHVGEVQASYWSETIKTECKKKNIPLL